MRVAGDIRPLSTDPAADLGNLFCRAALAWLIADGDMHLKNVALLRTADAGGRALVPVRSAPLHDAVTTRVFPGLAGNRMALVLAGKDDWLRLREFLVMARTIGLPGGEAEAALANLVARLSRRAAIPELPALARRSGAATTLRDQVPSIVAERSAALMQDLA